MNQTTPVALPAEAIYAPDYPIRTERLLLRPFNRGDVDAVSSYRSREDVAQYLFDRPLSHGEVEEAVRGRTGQVAFKVEGDKILLAAERQADGQVVGEVSLIWRSIADRQAEIGYIFHPDVHGQGLATEAARALLAFGFGQAELHRVYARCDARNAASSRVMEKLGMRREAHFRHHTHTKGHWDEELIYAILEDEWRAQR